MVTSGEKISPAIFLDISPARFEHDRYYSFRAEHSGVWPVQAEIRDGAYSQSLELVLYDDEDIVTASLYAWYTATVRRNFVYMDFDGEKIATHYFSEQIQAAAHEPEVEVVTLRLFGSPIARLIPEGVSDQYLIGLQPFDDDSADMRQAKENDRQHALTWAVAGATAMLNEIAYGNQPDNVWTP